MNRDRFDALVAQLERGHIGRARFLWKAAAVGLGAVGAGVGWATAREADPTPAPRSSQAVPPTPTPRAPDDVAAQPTAPPTRPPEPTAPPPPPEPTPRPRPTATAPPVAPTSPPVAARRTPTAPAEPTSTPLSETAPLQPSPTPSVGALSADEDDEAGQTVFDPFNWFCTPGPFWPWYPVVAPPEATDAFGIRWYGFRMDEADGRFIATAFAQDGQEISRGEGRRGDAGGFDWSYSYGDTMIHASFAVEGDGAGGLRIAGELAGQPLALVASPDGTVAIEPGGAPTLDIIQLTTLAQWSAVAPKVAGLIDVFAATGGGSPVASQGKCFAAGFLLPASIIGCAVSLGLGCAATGVFGGYILNNCE